MKYSHHRVGQDKSAAFAACLPGPAVGTVTLPYVINPPAASDQLARHASAHPGSVINHGATELIADMTATLSCEHAGAAAVARAYQSAAVHGAQLRLVVTAQTVRRQLTVNGLDQLIPVARACVDRFDRRVWPTSRIDCCLCRSLMCSPYAATPSANVYGPRTR